MSRSIHCVAFVMLLASSGFAAQWGMKTGDPGLKSAGSLAFGPDGVLFVGDTKAATVFAIDTGDKDGDPDEVDVHVRGLDKAIATVVGAKKVTVNDLAVNPQSGNVYISVACGEDNTPAIVKLLPNGEVEKLAMSNVNFSKVELPGAPEDKDTARGNRRDDSITDLAFSDGKVLVSGLSGSAGSSTVRELVFPFLAADKGVNIEIYHGAHGRYEDTAAVRTFVPFNIDGEPHLLAGFQCTPLVKFPLKKLKDTDNSVRGTTVAELGNRNRPLDMIVYKQGGETFLLITNTARGVMKVNTQDIEREEGITQRIDGTAGQAYETIESLKNVTQMDRLNEAHAVVTVSNDDGSLDLHTIELP